MKFLISGHRTGKTTKVLELARNAERPSAIFTFGSDEKKRVNYLLKEAGLKDVEVMTFEEARRQHRRFKTVFVDNSDFWIHELIRTNIDWDSVVYVTASGKIET